MPQIYEVIADTYYKNDNEENTVGFVRDDQNERHRLYNKWCTKTTLGIGLQLNRFDAEAQEAKDVYAGRYALTVTGATLLAIATAVAIATTAVFVWFIAMHTLPVLTIVGLSVGATLLSVGSVSLAVFTVILSVKSVINFIKLQSYLKPFKETNKKIKEVIKFIKPVMDNSISLDEKYIKVKMIEEMMMNGIDGNSKLDIEDLRNTFTEEDLHNISRDAFLRLRGVEYREFEKQIFEANILKANNVSLEKKNTLREFFEEYQNRSDYFTYNRWAFQQYCEMEEKILGDEDLEVQVEDIRLTKLPASERYIRTEDL